MTEREKEIRVKLGRAMSGRDEEYDEPEVDISYLLDEVERLRSEVDKARRAIDMARAVR